MRRRTTASSFRASAWASRWSSGIVDAGSSASRRSRCSASTGQARAHRGQRRRAAPYHATSEVSTPTNARLTDVYWQRPENAGRATFDADAPFGLPFRPSPFRARVETDVAGTRIVRELPVQYRYEGAGLVGEKRMELNVVPSFAVSVSPQIVVVPEAGASAAGASGRARAARHRHQRLERPGLRHGSAQDARGLAGVAGDRGDTLHARRRVDDDALHGDAAGTGDAGEQEISAEVVVGDASTPPATSGSATRSSSTRTFSVVTRSSLPSPDSRSST